MAPEQTGQDRSSTRSATSIAGDHRSTRFPPARFPPRRDAMEWIHCHLARTPAPPVERAAQVPGPVSAIVLQLLAKNAADRYQTASGLEAELRRCLGEWETRGRIDAFQLATRDGSDRLQVAEKLTARRAWRRCSRRSTRCRRRTPAGAGSGRPGGIVGGDELHQILASSRALFARANTSPDATALRRESPRLRGRSAHPRHQRREWPAGATPARRAGGDARSFGTVPRLGLLIYKPPPCRARRRAQTASICFPPLHRSFARERLPRRCPDDLSGSTPRPRRDRGPGRARGLRNCSSSRTVTRGRSTHPLRRPRQHPAAAGAHLSSRRSRTTRWRRVADAVARRRWPTKPSRRWCTTAPPQPVLRLQIPSPFATTVCSPSRRTPSA